VFEDAGVDVRVFQSTYLTEWYTDGFNTVEKNAALVDKYPGKLIADGRWDPREGEVGLKQLEEDAKRHNLKGRQALHGGVVQGIARLDAQAARGAVLPGVPLHGGRLRGRGILIPAAAA
jgi:predicted TIM-barrel fold metal-dependent hydrolase